MSSGRPINNHLINFGKTYEKYGDQCINFDKEWYGKTMNKNKKLKAKPPTFYICDQELACSMNNEKCGKECKYTTDISHAKYNTNLRFKRHADGSMWQIAF